MTFWVLTLAANAFGGAIATDRPSVATSARTVDTGVVQLETGAQLDAGDGAMLSLPTLVRYGVTSAHELRVTTNVIGVGGALVAPSIGAEWKANLVNEGTTAVGTLVGTSIGVGNGDVVAYASGLLDLNLGPVLAWSNVGVFTAGIANQLVVVGTYSIGASVSIQGAYSGHLEYSGATFGGLAAGVLQLGVTWAKDDLAFDGFIQPSFPDFDAVTLGVGMAYRWD